MPICEITMLEGRTPEMKEKLIADVSQAIVDSVGAPPETVRIILREIKDHEFGVAGVARSVKKREKAAAA